MIGTEPTRSIADVLVVGAGVIGMAVAWQAAVGRALGRRL